MNRKNELEHEAIRKVDAMLTDLWINALLCTNGYYTKRISEMETAEDLSKWNLFKERLK